MEIKELVPKLVEHYQRCIDEMPKQKWRKFISQKEVLCGICYCSNHLFDTFIYGSRFSDKFIGGNGNEKLCKYPYDASSYSEAKELLQIRLNRLKDFL
jgi:hypothetical protein